MRLSCWLLISVVFMVGIVNFAGRANFYGSIEATSEFDLSGGLSVSDCYSTFTLDYPISNWVFGGVATFDLGGLD